MEKDAQIASLTTKLENTTGKVPINATTDLPKIKEEEKTPMKHTR